MAILRARTGWLILPVSDCLAQFFRAQPDIVFFHVRPVCQMPSTARTLRETSGSALMFAGVLAQNLWLPILSAIDLSPLGYQRMVHMPLASVSSTSSAGCKCVLQFGHSD
jgi:hypothetical protein